MQKAFERTMLSKRVKAVGPYQSFDKHMGQAAQDCCKSNKTVKREIEIAIPFPY